MTDLHEFNPDWYDPKEVEQYQEAIRGLRLMWSRVPTKSGRPSKGPNWFAVTMCEKCHGIGMTSSKQAQKNRFTCKTCRGPSLVVWADGKAPDEDEQYETWAKGKSVTKPKDHGEGELHHVPYAMDGRLHACQASGHGDVIVHPKAPRWKIKATGQHICKDCRDRWAKQNPGVKITGGDPFGDNTAT